MFQNMKGSGNIQKKKLVKSKFFFASKVLRTLASAEKKVAHKNINVTAIQD
jgi:hypothetical protein